MTDDIKPIPPHIIREAVRGIMTPEERARDDQRQAEERDAAEPRFRIIDGLSSPEDAERGIFSRQWLVQEVDGCTCGSPGYPPGHEADCGEEGLGRVTDILDVYAAAMAMLVEIDAELKWREGDEPPTEPRPFAQVNTIGLRVIRERLSNA